MFTFTDRGGENVCLRPEATASIARAYIQHGMVNLPQPVKFFYFGPMFRHERRKPAGRDVFISLVLKHWATETRLLTPK